MNDIQGFRTSNEGVARKLSDCPTFAQGVFSLGNAHPVSDLASGPLVDGGRNQDFLKQDIFDRWADKRSRVLNFVVHLDQGCRSNALTSFSDWRRGNLKPRSKVPHLYTLSGIERREESIFFLKGDRSRRKVNTPDARLSPRVILKRAPSRHRVAYRDATRRRVSYK
jgi:hypothetical protein